MLSILCPCKSPHLDKLEIEYHADDEDDVLLQYIATTFPHLTSLRIHRYQVNRRMYLLHTSLTLLLLSLNSVVLRYI